MMRGDTAITQAKDILLSHPLSIATDARLVSTCELLTRQSECCLEPLPLAFAYQVRFLLGAIHERLQKSQDHTDDKSIFRTLQEATADIDSWLSEWDVRMSECVFDLPTSASRLNHLTTCLSGISQPTAGFFRSSAAIQRAYAQLFHNCIALRGLKTVDDAKALSPEMRAIALQAIQSAKECVSICLNNQEYREGLKYAGEHCEGISKKSYLVLTLPLSCIYTYVCSICWCFPVAICETVSRRCRSRRNDVPCRRSGDYTH